MATATNVLDLLTSINVNVSGTVHVSVILAKLLLLRIPSLNKDKVKV